MGRLCVAVYACVHTGVPPALALPKKGICTWCVGELSCFSQVAAMLPQVPCGVNHSPVL